MRISCNNVGIQKAAKIINKGGIVIFPTDTVYGIGCDPYNQKAVLSLYKIKKREKTKPLPVIGYSKKELEKIAEFNNKAEKIAELFWPGPITLILKVKDENIKKSLGLGKKIAVRVPNNQCALSLLKECKLLVATSANISGTTSLTDPDDCKKDLDGYDLLIDGGILSDDGESTIVEIDGNKVRIVRSGSVSEEELKKFF
uniref:L-threonylcarbamoyladenylate synthase n=1 Tax=uncultured marine thaumarchaeote KM3_156_B03 TaxID=1456022 RepID=A0A075GE42_9ARCH|nr:Sua5/YciO/YrdC/YwlC family protein (rimN, SUA5) [uncultured marine thaumarchaeote KM3_156_B03]